MKKNYLKKPTGFPRHFMENPGRLIAFPSTRLAIRTNVFCQEKLSKIGEHFPALAVLLKISRYSGE